jgi:hypothetical protein
MACCACDIAVLSRCTGVRGLRNLLQCLLLLLLLPLLRWLRCVPSPRRPRLRMQHWLSRLKPTTANNVTKAMIPAGSPVPNRPGKSPIRPHCEAIFPERISQGCAEDDRVFVVRRTFLIIVCHCPRAGPVPNRPRQGPSLLHIAPFQAHIFFRHAAPEFDAAR